MVEAEGLIQPRLTEERDDRCRVARQAGCGVIVEDDALLTFKCPTRDPYPAATGEGGGCGDTVSIVEAQGSSAVHHGSTLLRGWSPLHRAQRSVLFLPGGAGLAGGGGAAPPRAAGVIWLISSSTFCHVLRFSVNQGL